MPEQTLIQQESQSLQLQRLKTEQALLAFEEAWEEDKEQLLEGIPKNLLFLTKAMAFQIWAKDHFDGDRDALLEALDVSHVPQP